MSHQTTTVELLDALPSVDQNQGAVVTEEQQHEASISCFELAETIDASTRSIRRNRGDSQRPEEYLEESNAPFSPHSSFEIVHPGDSQLPRNRRTSEHRPSGFLGGSGEFSYRPMSSSRRTGSKKVAVPGIFSTANNTMVPPPAMMAMDKLHDSKMTDKTMDDSGYSSIASSVRIQEIDEEDLSSEDLSSVDGTTTPPSRHELTVEEDQKDNGAGGAATATSGGESCTIGSISSGDESAASATKANKKKRNVRHTARPDGAMQLPCNDSRGRPRTRGRGRPCRPTRGPRPAVAPPKELHPLIPIDPTAPIPSPFSIQLPANDDDTKAEK